MKTSAENLIFRAEPAKIEAVEGADNGRFEGVAYSGRVIEGHGYWGNVVFDLSTMSVSTPLAALQDHFRSRRAGVVEAFELSNESGLQVSGKLLGNEYGQEVFKDGADGFPWQMSVLIVPKLIEEHHAPVNVNGQTVQASQDVPLIIFKNSVIREVSFCSLGADPNTSATVFSGENQEFNFSKTVFSGGVGMTLEEENAKLKAQLDAMNAQFSQKDEALKNAAAVLEAARLSKRLEDINKCFSAAGVTASDEEKQAFSAMNDAAFNAASAMIAKAAAAVNAGVKAEKNKELTGAFSFQDTPDDLDFAMKEVNKALGLDGGK